MLNDVGRHELCASRANKENKNCEAIGLEGGTKARVIDEGMDPDSVILQHTDSLFFRSTILESINALRMWLLCGQRSGCKGDQGALGSKHHLLSNSACCTCEF